MSKGFVKAQGSHQFLEFWFNGKYILQTFCSHDNQDINDYLIIMMKNQCRLGKDDFLDLANCPLSREGYVTKLVERGIIRMKDLPVPSKIE
ncbi:hypothetical protein [Chitinophaga sp. S165]|uniref:hypothetical protein n=1 Tax=Chitinophaga sp. S165 TaxID=2135462 RepID=UPI0011B71226|nr:hypothetical protein [Chitinophaga sp. S165]